MTVVMSIQKFLVTCLIHIDTLKTFAKIRTCFKSNPNLPEAQQILAMSHLTTWRLNN